MSSFNTSDGWYLLPGFASIVNASTFNGKSTGSCVFLKTTLANPTSYFYTILNGLDTTLSYTINFQYSMRTTTGDVFACRTPDIFTASVFNGDSSVILFNGRPTSNNWATITCAAFTPLSSTIMFIFNAHQEGTQGETAILIDEVQINPSTGITFTSSGTITYSSAASTKPQFNIVSTVLEDFESLSTYNQWSSWAFQSYSVSNNWVYSLRTWITSGDSPNAGTAYKLRYELLTKDAFNYTYTTLTGLTVGQTYTLSAVNTTGGSSSGYTIAWNMYDGSALTTLWSGYATWGGTPTTITRSFTATNTTMQMLMVAWAHSGLRSTTFQIDQFNITPFEGLNKRGLTSFIFRPEFGRNTLSSSTVCSPPQNVQARGGNTFVNIRWDPPASNGGSNVTAYFVAYHVTSSGWTPDFSYYHNPTPDVRNVLFTSLVNGRSYTFYVWAFNDRGPGEVATVVSVTTNTTPADITPSTLTSSLFGNFENITNATSMLHSTFTIKDQWAYSKYAGVGLISSVMPRLPRQFYVDYYFMTAPEGFYGLYLNTYSTRPQVYAYTILSDMNTSTSYTITFSMGMISGKATPDWVTIRAYDGTNPSILLFNGRPDVPEFSSYACTSFVPTSSTMMIVIHAIHEGTGWETAIIIDDLRINPWTGLQCSASGSPITYTSMLADLPPTNLTSSVFGDFEGLTTNLNKDSNAWVQPDGIIDYWNMHGSPSVAYLAHLNTSGLRYAMSLQSMGTESYSYMYTILAGLDTSTTYTLSFLAIGNRTGELFTINAYDGTNVRTLRDATFTSSSARYTVSGFIPTSSIVMIVITQVQLSANGFNNTYDSFTITPFKGIRKVVRGVTYTPRASINTLSLLTPPSAPPNFRVTTYGDSSLALAWDTPLDLGGASSIGNYAVFRYVTSTGYVNTITTKSNSLTLASLTSGARYRLDLVAVTAAGPGQVTTLEVVCQTLPGGPGNVSVRAAPQSVLMTWTASTGGNITYEVRYTPSGGVMQTYTTTQLYFFFPSLQSGLVHSFQIRATNVRGSSSWSGTLTATPRSLPSSLTSTVFGNFENIGVYSQFTLLANQTMDNWTFGPRAGIAPSSILPITGARQNYVTYMDCTTSSRLQYVFTYLSNLPAQPHTISFRYAPRTFSGVPLPDEFTVMVYNGTETTEIWNGLPSASGLAFTTCTCTPFTPTVSGSTVMIVASCYQTGSQANSGLLLDSFEITPWTTASLYDVGPFPYTTEVSTTLSVTGVTSKSAAISWFYQFAPMSSVRIYLNNAVYRTMETDARSLLLTELSPSMTYSVGVSAFVGQTEMARKTITFTTMQEPPAVPTNLTTTPGNESIQLSWGAAARATSYRLVIDNVNVIQGISTTSYLATALTAGQMYSFQVFAVNAAGSSPGSQVVTSIPLPSAIQSLWLQATGSGSVVIREIATSAFKTHQKHLSDVLTNTSSETLQTLLTQEDASKTTFLTALESVAVQKGLSDQALRSILNYYNLP